MKDREPQRLAICRLLTLLLILLVGLGSANQVNGASLRRVPSSDNNPPFNFSKFVTASKDVDLTGSTQIRKHTLQNMCSRKLVQLVTVKQKKHKVNARGRVRANSNQTDHRLVFLPTQKSNTIHIFGEFNNIYICFNTRGRLVARMKIPRKHPELCEFREEYSSFGEYYTYRTAVKDKTWKMGFKKNGKPIKGTKKNKNEQCDRFEKYPKPSRSSHSCIPKAGQGPGGVDMCDIFDRIVPNLRHRKSHKLHRKGQNG